MTTALTQLTDTDYSREKIELIKRTIAIGATDDELQLFLYAAKKTGLDPLTRQIYAVKRWNKDAGREVMTVQTGIDGYRLIADRTGKLAGITDPLFDDESGAHPGKAAVTVRKLVEGHIVDFTASARWSEYVQTNKDGNPVKMWVKMPYLMLGKCAEALALRKAFPADLSGVYTAEEMAQADNDTQRDAVHAEVERQKAAAPDVIPPENAWIYNKASGVLICRILDARKSKKKKGDGELVTLKLNNSINGKSLIYYFHSTHVELLLNAIGKVVKLMVGENKDGYVNVSDVLEVDGQPVPQQHDTAEMQARMLASAMDFTEDDLTQLLDRFCAGSWAVVLDKLKDEKVRRETEEKADATG